MMALQYPPPQNWQDFETMCRELMERAWGAPAQKHGRSGQRQSGVDLYAQVGGQWVAAQCKLKNWWRGGAVTQDELVTEVKAATKFENADRKLTRYTLLTTAERDASIQKVARRLSGAPPNGFAVDILFWDD